jgi:transcriptional regulator with XRE-family HTH domain
LPGSARGVSPIARGAAFYTEWMQDRAGAADIARTGTAFAARRAEMGLSLRDLGAMKIISPTSLVQFEKGRAWPRERRRALLEKAVQWPPGTLARIRQGGPVPTGRHRWESDEETAATENSLITNTLAVAMNSVTAAIAKLPAADDPRFADEVQAVLGDLRQLEAVTGRAVRLSGASRPAVAALTAVRRHYHDLMVRAAAAPGATLGQRIYAARTAASLSQEDTAALLGVEGAQVAAIEAEQLPGPVLASAVKALIARLSEP